ncbi:MAG TPA: hypothetical protein VK988_16790, partial [Acidimicrobiales bacterium]|nr:hypothetical protein [Acidimicrobiales bacterium]
GPENIDLVKRSGRVAYQYFPEEKRGPSGVKPDPRLSRLALAGGAGFELRYSVQNTVGRPVVTTFVTSPVGTTQYVLDRRSSKGATYSLTWRITPSGAALVNPPATPLMSAGALPRAGTLAVSATFGESDEIGADNEWFEHRYQFEVSGSSLSALFPGEMWHRWYMNGEVWAGEDVRPTLRPTGRQLL